MPYVRNPAAVAAGRVAADRAVGHRQRCRRRAEMPPPSRLAELPLIVLSVTVDIAVQIRDAAADSRRPSCR